MRSRSSAVTLVALAVAAAAACNGKLKVGDKAPLPEEAAGEAGADSESVGGGESGGSAGASAGGRPSGGSAGALSGGRSGSSGASGSGTSGSGASGTSGTSGASGTTGRAGSSGAGGTDSGSGGSSAASGSGGSGNVAGVPEWVDMAPPTDPIGGSSEGCPSGPLPPAEECERLGLPCGECEEVGLVCGYVWDPTMYQECTCRRLLGGGQGWDCDSWGAEFAYCPSEPPEHGTDCYGYIGLLCVYPPGLRECTCKDDPAIWDCPAVVEPDRPDPPEGVDPEQPLSDLSDEERDQWCDWYSTLAAGGPGRPPTRDRPVTEDGYTDGPGCVADLPGCGAIVPVVSKAQCAANLELSECAAPIGLLTKCAGDVLSGGCRALDSECIDYFDTPGCDGTVASVGMEGVGRLDCSIKVE